MKSNQMSLAVLVVAALSGLSLTYGLLYGTALLGHTMLWAAASGALFGLAWVLDRRLDWAWVLRALCLGLHVGGVVAMWRVVVALGEGAK